MAGLDRATLAEGRRLYTLCDELAERGDWITHGRAVDALDAWRDTHARVLLAEAEAAAALREQVDTADRERDALTRSRDWWIQTARASAEQVARAEALCAEWRALDMGTGLYPQDTEHRRAHEDRAEQCADDLEAALAGPTDREGVDRG